MIGIKFGGGDSSLEVGVVTKKVRKNPLLKFRMKSLYVFRNIFLMELIGV